MMAIEQLIVLHIKQMLGYPDYCVVLKPFRLGLLPSLPDFLIHYIAIETVNTE